MPKSEDIVQFPTRLLAVTTELFEGTTGDEGAGGTVGAGATGAFGILFEVVLLLAFIVEGRGLGGATVKMGLLGSKAVLYTI